MYPVSFEADYFPENRNRLTVALRYFWAIPAMIVAALYSFGAYIAAIIAWFAIVFTGRYPEGLYNFNAGALRMIQRAQSYMNLTTDEYPPFNGDDDPSYPVRVGIPAPLGAYDRVKAGLRFLIGIPVMLLAMVQGLILSVCTLISWFAIVFTGKHPDGLFKPMHSALTYGTRAGAYFMLMTEDYPPFSEEEGAGAPAGAIERETTRR